MRKFRDRIKEHEADLRLNRPHTVLYLSSPPPKLKDLLNTKIDPVQAINRSGVYIIPFQKDSKYFIYVGMTMRKIRDRIKEHEANLRLNRPHTVLYLSSPPPKLNDLLNTNIDPVQAVNRSEHTLYLSKKIVNILFMLV